MKQQKHVIIGCVVLALAALLILIVIFAPRFAAIKGLKDRMATIAEGEPEYVVINDPVRENGDILGSRGQEVRLSRGDAVALCSYIVEITDHCSLTRSTRTALDTWDTLVIVKSASGETVQIYVTKDSFYYANNGRICEFRANDAEYYSVFYAFVQAAFE